MLPPRVLFLGSYPPRECGIATFTKDVVDSYDRAFGVSSPVIAIDEPGAEIAPVSVPKSSHGSSEQDRYSYGSRRRRSSTVYPADLVNIQHEYGLFGGERGEWLVDLIARATEAGRR